MKDYNQAFVRIVSFVVFAVVVSSCGGDVDSDGDSEKSDSQYSVSASVDSRDNFDGDLQGQFQSDEHIVEGKVARKAVVISGSHFMQCLPKTKRKISVVTQCEIKDDSAKIDSTKKVLVKTRRFVKGTDEIEEVRNIYTVSDDGRFFDVEIFDPDHDVILTVEILGEDGAQNIFEKTLKTSDFSDVMRNVQSSKLDEDA